MEAVPADAAVLTWTFKHSAWLATADTSKQHTTQRMRRSQMCNDDDDSGDDEGDRQDDEDDPPRARKSKEAEDEASRASPARVFVPQRGDRWP